MISSLYLYFSPVTSVTPVTPERKKRNHPINPQMVGFPIFSLVPQNFSGRPPLFL